MINCLKRTVVCVIRDATGKVIGVGRNQCRPPLKMVNEMTWKQVPTCARMHIVATEENYNGAGCNSIHAEINAIADLQPGVLPFEALIIGHDFACEPCTEALHAAGITSIRVITH
jgi:deoxycytidylate deaminase